jgi:hypothetical protein
MRRRIVGLALACFYASRIAVEAQEFKFLDRKVQVHGFASQGFVYTGENNWLSMHTSQGSAAFTDFGVNVSSEIAEKLRVGAQFYDRNIGEIGRWRPEVDWAFADYRFKPWLGFRGGKIKTAIGLYNDTQDLDLLQTWAVLPQSIDPLDLRSSTISHVGGDLYGAIKPRKNLGTISYTAYAGQRPQDPQGGFVLGLASVGLTLHAYGGWVQGEDLRWDTPVKGLLVGASLMNQHITGHGVLTGSGAGNTFLENLLHLPAGSLEREHSRKDDYYQYYLQYTWRGLRLDGEYRREFRDEWVGYWEPGSTALAATFDAISDSRAWYGSAAYRVSKRLELGTYFSWYIADWREDRSPPTNHVYDRVASARFDLNNHWYAKIEGHFMNGYGAFDSIRGFYGQQNPNGLDPNTNALVARTGFSF